MARLAREGVAPAADLETLQHKREELDASIRAREAEKGNLDAQERSLTSRLEKVHRFEREGTDHLYEEYYRLLAKAAPMRAIGKTFHICSSFLVT